MANSSYNKCMYMGRLVRDPEKRTTNSGKSVASFTIAVDRIDDSEADFIDIVAWEEKADFICNYFTKGRMIFVDGHMRSRKWQSKDGKTQSKLECIADIVRFADSKPKANTEPIADVKADSGAGFDAVLDIVDDNDLPF